MTQYAVVVVRGQAAPSGVVAPEVHSQPEPPVQEARACTETTKAGEPCKGTPGDDGLCAAHKKAAASGDDK